MLNVAVKTHRREPVRLLFPRMRKKKTAHDWRSFMSFQDWLLFVQIAYAYEKSVDAFEKFLAEISVVSS